MINQPISTNTKVNPFKNAKKPTVTQLQEQMASFYDEHILLQEQTALNKFAANIQLFINVILAMRPKAENVSDLLINSMRINAISTKADTLEKVNAAKSVIATAWMDIVHNNIEHVEVIALSSSLGEVCNRLGYSSAREVGLQKNQNDVTRIVKEIEQEALQIMNDFDKKLAEEIENQAMNDPEFRKFAEEVLEETKKVEQELQNKNPQPKQQEENVIKHSWRDLA